MEIQTNPNIEDLKLVLWGAGFLILLMLSVIGYFMRDQLQSTKNLTRAVTTLNTTVTVIKTQLELQSPVTEHRLNDHSEKIRGIDKRLTIIETDHRNFHKSKTKET